ncbi:expressed unknown protein [Seminavis robusta]|uniref:Uncharacterized protein n=1 Tax=Seminavis robusta TaxID=568900 RepID=A0A9N8E1B9_9STRA|nr:expressed unknown protein [Seminavis robusta]|eukprot:Sro552_g165020.1 n/a (225) ;mRNA; f:12001-12868
MYINGGDLEMDCNGSPQCTLGEEVTLTGSLQYRGIEDTGLVDGYAFASASMMFVGVLIDMLQYLQVPICGDYISTGYGDDDRGEEVECPEDGTYNFFLQYPLPDETSKAVWVATGWDAHAEISFYSEANNPESLIGVCELTFITAVTAGQGSSPLEKIPIPSAMVTAMVILAFAGFLIITCFYRMIRDCCCGKKKKTSDKLKELEEATTIAEAKSTTEFTKMKD